MAAKVADRASATGSVEPRSGRNWGTKVRKNSATFGFSAFDTKPCRNGRPPRLLLGLGRLAGGVQHPHAEIEQIGDADELEGGVGGGRGRQQRRDAERGGRRRRPPPGPPA